MYGFRVRRGLCSAAIVVLLLVSCAGVTTKHAEPTTIIVRNQSGEFIQQVSLIEHGKTKTAVVRTGTIAPVPMGVSQTVARGAQAPRLPEIISVRWLDLEGSDLSKEIDLQSLLQQTAGIPGDALVIEFRPHNEVVAFIEATQ